MSEELADLFGLEESDEDVFDNPPPTAQEEPGVSEVPENLEKEHAENLEKEHVTEGGEDEVPQQEPSQLPEGSPPATTAGDPATTEGGGLIDVPPEGMDDDDIEDLFGGSDSDEGKETAGLITEPPPEEEAKKIVVKRYIPSGKPRQITTPMLPLPPPESEESNKTRLYLVNVPNVIGFEPEAFEEDRYLPPSDKTKTSWVRWRIARDDEVEGGYVKESNTKLVTWSDGSQSLVIGKEVFDCVMHQQENHYVFGSYYLPEPDYDDSADEGGESDIVKFRLSQCHGRLDQRLSVKASIKSSVVAARNINRKHRKLEKTRFMSSEYRMQVRRDANVRLMDRTRLKQKQQQAQRTTPRKKTADLTERDLEDLSDDLSEDSEEVVANPAALSRAKTQISSEEDSDDQLIGFSRRKKSMFIDDD